MGLVKNYTCSEAIKPYRIVAIDGATELISTAVSGAVSIIGVTGVVGSNAEGERVDIYKDDVQTVEFGGDVEAGDPLTADAQGRAIAANPAADTTVRLIGFAEETGGVGVRGQVHINIQTLRG
jgi:hypothetical protein